MVAQPGGIAYIALGSNQGVREAYLRSAVVALDAHPEVDVLRASSVYETPAHTLRPDEEQPPYLNAVIEVRTTLSPEDLLRHGHAVEAAAGRRRREDTRWAPRTLDVDLLLYGREVRATGTPRLPHPRLHQRRFVLQPLAELAPGLMVPTLNNRTVAELLRRCPDQDRLESTDHTLLAASRPRAT